MASTSSSLSGPVIARDELHVAPAPEIPFPAPAMSPMRSQRSAAKAAMSASKAQAAAAAAAAASADRTTDMDTEDWMSEPDLTNDDTAESWTAGEGETDEGMHVSEHDAEDNLSYAEEDAVTEEEDLKPPPAKKQRKTPVKRKSAKTQVASDDTNEDGAEMDHLPSTPSPNKKGKGRAKAAKSNGKQSHKQEEEDGHATDSSALTPAEDLDADEKPKKKQRKPRKPREPKPEPVYVIPDVEKQPNPGYEGRLGYACLNTILRKKKPLSIFCSRTCRIDTIKKNGMDFLKELGRANMKDLVQLIEWNEENNIRFMRLSSEMFPFASHGEYGYDLEYAQEELAAAGALARKYGHRLTTHPGQFTQLGSPRGVVVKNAVKDLEYHCEMLDRMGMGKDSVMIIHGGGIFGDKPATLERIKKNYTELLPDRVKARVVLENDEICYNVDDLLPLCEELNIPLVLDYHHDWIYPRAEQSLEELMPRILATWERKGIKPKFHLSEPRPGAVTVMERRAHSDRCKKLPTPLPSHVDLMIEAKDKEQAVMELHRIYDLQPVKHESLRPPAEVETLRTQGRKSSKKKKEEDGEEEEEEEEGVDGEQEDGVAEAVDPDEAMVDVDGAQVAPPVEPSDAKKAKTPTKRGRAKKQKEGKEEEETAPASMTATNGIKSERVEQDDIGTATPSKKRKTTNPAAKTPRARKSKAEQVEAEVRAEPPEAEPVEDMRLADVPEDIVDKVPCEKSALEQEKAMA